MSEATQVAETPERVFARELRHMLDRATQSGSAGIPWVEVVRTIVEASERLADAKDAEATRKAMHR